MEPEQNLYPISYLAKKNTMKSWPFTARENLKTQLWPRTSHSSKTTLPIWSSSWANTRRTRVKTQAVATESK
jgi:hypothetical protein